MRDLAATTSTMSSREIAELCGKRHDNVMTDIRNMLELLKIQSPEFLGDYKDDKGRTYPCFNLPKRETLITTRAREATLFYRGAESVLSRLVTTQH